MKRTIVLLLLTVVPLLSFGQLSGKKMGKVSGEIMDKTRQEPIPYATVVIKNMKGETVTGTISSEKGKFSIDKIPFDTYRVVIQFMGYKKFEKQIEVSLTHRKVNLGTILLIPSMAKLSEVVVTAERTTVEQLIDRKVVTVGKDLSSSGASAAEIMNKIPSVRVDIDGNLYLRGDGNVRVLVDGRPTNVPVSTLLKQIPASSIAKIELITNPSAKYSPEGMSGIINIILKKNAKMGFNGLLSGSVTLKEHMETDAALNLNYRTGKFNFYTNLGVNYGKDEKLGFLNEINGPGEDLTILSKESGELVKFGVDFYLDDNNVISVYTNQNFIDEETNLITKVTFPQQPADDYTQKTLAGTDGLSSTYNLNAKHDFSKKGHSIELEIDYNKYDNDGDSDYLFEGNPSLDSYQDFNQTGRTNLIASLDYVNPLSEHIDLELGAEFRSRSSENDYMSTNPDLVDVFYTYDEDIYSAYTTFSQDIDKWAYQVGLRFENFISEGKQEGKSVFKKEKARVYPSAYVTFAPNEDHSFQVSYSRRIDRPSFWQLNPTRNFATTRVTSIGNPELNAELTDAFEFNYSIKLGRARLRAGVYYRFLDDNITQVMYEDPENPQRYIMTYANTGKKENYGVEASAYMKFFDLWNFRFNLNTYTYTASGLIAGDFIDKKSTMYNLSTSNSFTVTDRLDLQLFAMYRSAFETLQFGLEEMYFVNLGARYSFWDNKASINLSVNDIFDTRVHKISTDRPVPQVGQFKSESQYVQIGFSYRFGDGKNRKRRRQEIKHNTGGGGVF